VILLRHDEVFLIPRWSRAEAEQLSSAVDLFGVIQCFIFLFFTGFP